MVVLLRLAVFDPRCGETHSGQLAAAVGWPRHLEELRGVLWREHAWRQRQGLWGRCVSAGSRDWWNGDLEFARWETPCEDANTAAVWVVELVWGSGASWPEGSRSRWDARSFIKSPFDAGLTLLVGAAADVDVKLDADTLFRPGAPRRPRGY